MNLKERIKSWGARFWATQVDFINDTMAEIDIKPVVIRNRMDLWIVWTKIALGTVLVAVLMYASWAQGSIPR